MPWVVLTCLFRVHYPAFWLVVVERVGDAYLFEQLKHSVEFLRQTTQHMWQLVKCNCG